MSTAATRKPPCAPTIADAATIGRPAARARAAAACRRVSASGRASTIAAIATPASCSASAVAYALSLFANTTARDAGPHGVALDVRARGPREQRAGQVVVRVRDAALVRAGREHDRRARTFHSRCRGTCAGGAGEVIGDALDETDEIAVVLAEGRRAREQRDIGVRGELARHVAAIQSAAATPSIVGASPSRLAAEARVLVADDHARAGVRRGAAAAASPAGPAPIDEHVAVRVLVLVAIGIGLASRRGPCRRRGGSRARTGATTCGDGGHMNVL